MKHINLINHLSLINLKEYISKFIRIILLIGLSYIIIFPLLSKISMSIMSVQDLYDPTVVWIPRNISWDAYKMIFSKSDFIAAFINSFSLAILVSVLQLVSSTLIGYGFARFKVRGKEIWFALVIFTFLIPPQTLMIPNFLNFRFFDFLGISEPINLIGGFWPFAILAITSVGLRGGLFVYIIRQFFRGMPQQLEEAAYVDGAGPLRTFLKIMLPGAIPVLIVVFLFSFVWQWNEYYLTNIFMQNQQILPIVLNNLSFSLGEAPRTGEFVTTYGSVIENAGMLLFIIFPVLVFVFFQRYFIESIQRTGLVG